VVWKELSVDIIGEPSTKTCILAVGKDGIMLEISTFSMVGISLI
jgi:hypothetical protein